MAKRKVTVRRYLGWVRAHFSDGHANDLSKEIRKKRKKMKRRRDLFKVELDDLFYNVVCVEHDRYELGDLDASLDRKTNT